MMISEQNLSSWAERYRKNELSPSELATLKNALKESEYLRNSWEETLNLLTLLDKKAQREQMRRKIQSIAFNHYNSIKQAQTETTAQNKNTPVISLFSRKNFLKLTGMAAALVLLSSLATFWITKEKTTGNGAQYTLLRREIENIKYSQSKMMDSLNRQAEFFNNEPLYGGTGFALTNNGFVATNYHVVKDAHTIFVQTSDTESYKAYIIAFEPKTDVAILKIEDSSFRFGKTPLPYRIATQTSGLGQQVFTLGFPQDDLVYNEGYISCEKGFANDSTSYQLEMVANPGQSGAPILDKYGNIVALVTGKRSNTSGTTYAVHATTLIQLINSLPERTQNQIKLSGNNTRNLSRDAQVNKIRPYICSIKVN